MAKHDRPGTMATAMAAAAVTPTQEQKIATPATTGLIFHFSRPTDNKGRPRKVEWKRDTEPTKPGAKPRTEEFACFAFVNFNMGPVTIFARVNRTRDIVEDGAGKRFAVTTSISFPGFGMGFAKSEGVEIAGGNAAIKDAILTAYRTWDKANPIVVGAAPAPVAGVAASGRVVEYEPMEATA